MILIIRGNIMQKEINKIQKQFRILNGWEIIFDEKSDMKCQSTFNFEMKQGIIYGWESKSIMPKKYIIHEILHCCFCQLDAIQKSKNINYLTKREVEEYLIRDICSFFMVDKN